MTENAEYTAESQGADTGRAIAYQLPPTYAALHRDANSANPNTGIPLRTVVRQALLDGLGGIYSDFIEPVLRGEVDHGSLAANEAVIGHRFIEADAENDNVLSTARRGRATVNALNIGRLIRSIVATDLGRVGVALNSRSFRSDTLLPRS
jgi:hypothetical protein